MVKFSKRKKRLKHPLKLISELSYHKNLLKKDTSLCINYFPKHHLDIFFILLTSLKIR